METVEVVIKLPKKEYDYMIANPTRYNVCDDETLLYNYIKDGTVLPKGHGDLVDMNTVTSTYNLQGELTSYDAVVVLEADKEA